MSWAAGTPRPCPRPCLHRASERPELERTAHSAVYGSPKALLLSASPTPRPPRPLTRPPRPPAPQVRPRVRHRAAPGARAGAARPVGVCQLSQGGAGRATSIYLLIV